MVDVSYGVALSLTRVQSLTLCLVMWPDLCFAGHFEKFVSDL